MYAAPPSMPSALTTSTVLFRSWLRSHGLGTSHGCRVLPELGSMEQR